MDPLKVRPGTAVQVNILDELQWVEDLEWFDGPLLSLFRGGGGEAYLANWCDCDDTAHRWLIFEVQPQNLEMYQEGRIRLRDLIFSEVRRQPAFLADLTGEGWRGASVVSLADIPSSYLPKEAG